MKYSLLKLLETRASNLSPAMLLTLGCAFAASVAGAEVRFVVAPNGRDNGSGTWEQPFATLERARQAVRELKAAGPLTQPVEVCVRGGTHYLAQPLVFSPEDSGTEPAPIGFLCHGIGNATVHVDNVEMSCR